jgi:hypothetical protein
MKLIPLTRGLVAIVDETDYQRLSRIKWYALRCNRTFYAACHSSERPRKMILMHRLVVYAPSVKKVDHINGNTLDNRRANLRLASNAQNLHNCKVARTNNTSGFKGAIFDKRIGRWAAQIRFRGKRYNLGYFDTPELAAQEYDRAARLLFRQFARTNFS